MTDTPERILKREAKTSDYMLKAGLTCEDCAGPIGGLRCLCIPCRLSAKETRCTRCCRESDLVTRSPRARSTAPWGY